MSVAKKKILIHGEPNLPGCKNFINLSGPKAYMKVIERLIARCLN